jgi:hypothetical protein
MRFEGRWLAGLGVAVCLSLSVAVVVPALAADPTAADVQWAQGILKGKGLYSGRANGDFNDPTKAALRSYQKSAGLRQTGQLDQATTAHMLAERQSAASPTMGNLAGPGGRPQPSKVNRDAEAPKPTAAPRMGVDTHGSPEGEQALGVFGGHAPTGASRDRARDGSTGSAARGVSSGEPVPQAAPRTRVDSVGQPPPDGMTEMADPAESGITVPPWVRTGVIGVLGASFAFAGVSFWMSGRRPSRKQRGNSPTQPMASRREPSFDGGGGAGRAPDLRATRHS